MTKTPSNRDFVRSLARGLEVIRAFTRTQPRQTLSDISRTTGMTRATVRRFVHTLVREGYAESDGKESVSVAVLEEEDVVYVASSTPPDRFVSISVSVGSRTPAHAVSSGRVLLAMLPEDEQLAYLDKVKLQKFTPNTITSKVKLRSQLEEARVQGYSIVDQELEIGLRSISVPIRDQAGRVIAALNVACPSSRITPDDMRSDILLELQAASQEITSNLQR